MNHTDIRLDSCLKVIECRLPQCVPDQPNAGVRAVRGACGSPPHLEALEIVGRQIEREVSGICPQPRTADRRVIEVERDSRSLSQWRDPADDHLTLTRRTGDRMFIPATPAL